MKEINLEGVEKEQCLDHIQQVNYYTKATLTGKIVSSMSA